MVNMNPFNLICHRIPERSFHIKGHQFPVCARCTGFYISLIGYFVYAVFNYIDYSAELIAFAFLLLIPAFADGLLQLGTEWQSNNILRLITGLLGGLGLGILIKALKFFIYLNGGF